MTGKRRAAKVATSAAAFAAAATAALTFAGAASAATFNATDAPSFATAIASANSNTGANTIVLAAGSYNPTVTTVITNGPLTIQGPAPTASVSGPQAKFVGGAIQPSNNPVFKISPGVTVNFVDIAVSNAGGTGINPAIDDFGIVNLTQVGIGGALGPALTVEPTATASVTNSTIADGGDVGIVDDGTATLTNSTVTANANGGIDNSSGTLNLINTIDAENGSSSCFRAASSSDHSLDSGTTCGVSLSNANPLLGAIGSHGGTTPTLVPALGSPAIGAADLSACPSVDQRGAVRPGTEGSSHLCDIGAVQTDTVAPVLATANITAGDLGTSGVPVNYTTNWTDAGAPITTSSCTPVSGSTFPDGLTTVHCTSTDAFGNNGSGSFTVTVVHATQPVVTTTPSGTETVAAVNASGAHATFTASATDAVDGTDPVTCTPASGSLFALGNTTVNCSATDSLGLTGTAQLIVTVADQTAPVITVPSNISLQGSTLTTTVTYSPAPSATDNVDGTDPVTCSPASGSTFSAGTTTVMCTAQDLAGNIATKTFTVSYMFVSAPIVTTTPSGTVTVPALDASGAVVTFSATAQDAVDGTDPVTCTPQSGSKFPLGSTNVTCWATDSVGLTGVADLKVTVKDQTPPVITVPGNMVVLGSNNTTVTYSPAPYATDNVDGTDTVTCTPASGSPFPLGATLVTCTAHDAAGNIATKTFTVTVESEPPNNTGDNVQGEIGSQLSITATPADFGSILPGINNVYHTSAVATVTSTDSTTQLTIMDEDTGPNAGHLLNVIGGTTYSLAQPVEVQATSTSPFAAFPSGNPFTALSASPYQLLSYNGPVSNDAVTLNLEQSVGRTEALHNGTYSAVVLLQLSGTP